MDGTLITIWAIVFVTSAAIAYDIWVALKYGTASTISWVAWTASKKFPIIPFAFGILCGHLFWVQQTGMLHPQPPAQVAHDHDHDYVIPLDHHLHEVPRSGQWPTVRKHYLEAHPDCAACGSIVALEVHHVRPFHEHPELELDPNNLITLCRIDHLVFGHLHNFKSWNIHVREDTADYRRRMIARPQTHDP